MSTDPIEPLGRITPFLWFDSRAEEAAHFYASIFPDSRVDRVIRYGKAGPGPEGSVMTVDFRLQGQRFVALNGGPIYSFTPAVSFVVNCQTQEEIDKYWDELAVGGSHQPCGWLTDKYGLSWQIVPTILADLMARDDEGAARTTEAMLRMGKLMIADLRQAYESAG